MLALGHTFSLRIHRSVLGYNLRAFIHKQQQQKLNWIDLLKRKRNLTVSMYPCRHLGHLTGCGLHVYSLVSFPSFLTGDPIYLTGQPIYLTGQPISSLFSMFCFVVSLYCV